MIGKFGSIVLLLVFLCASQNASALLLAHVEVSNYTNSEVDITWATDASASTEVHYGLTIALGSTKTGDAGEIHKVSLTGLPKETTYFFEVVSDGQIDNNGGNFYQFQTAKTGAGSFHTLYGFVKDGQGQGIEGAVVLLTVEDSLKLSYLTGSNGDWTVDLTNLKNSSTYDVQSFANGNNVSLTVYAPDGQAGSGRKGSGAHTLAGVGSGAEQVADIIANESDSSLPVELSSFLGKYDVAKKSITLTWRTESEVGNLGFSIYRSEEKNGKYIKIGFVHGAGSSAMPNEYEFADEEAEAGKTYFYYLEDIDIAGEKNKSEIIKVVVVPTAQPVLPIPSKFVLLQNFPNPFNPETWLPYQLAETVPVSIRIYDPKGRIIRTMYFGEQQAGSYTTKDKAAFWDGKNDFGEHVASGTYFYQLEAGKFSAVRKMIIIT